MNELYTKEDHLMFLLHGGDIRQDSHFAVGPISRESLTHSDAMEFARQVTAISGIKYRPPSRYRVQQLTYSGVLDIEIPYWYEYMFSTEYRIYHRGEIDGVSAHVALVRYYDI